MPDTAGATLGSIIKVAGKAGALVKLAPDAIIPAKKTIIWVRGDTAPIAKLKVRKINKRKRLLLVQFKILSENTAKTDLVGLEVFMTKAGTGLSVPMPAASAEPTPTKTVPLVTSGEPSVTEVIPSPIAGSPKPPLFSIRWIHSQQKFQLAQIALGLASKPEKQLLGYAVRLYYPQTTASPLGALFLAYQSSASPTSSIQLLRSGSERSERVRIKRLDNRLSLCYLSPPLWTSLQLSGCIESVTIGETLSLQGSEELVANQVDRSSTSLRIKLNAGIQLDPKLQINLGLRVGPSQKENLTETSPSLLDGPTSLDSQFVGYHIGLRYQLLQFWNNRIAINATAQLSIDTLEVATGTDEDPQFYEVNSNYELAVVYHW